MYTDHIQQMINAERFLAKQHREMELAKGSLSEFIKQAWPIIESQPYIHGWHIDAMSDHMEAISKNQINRIIINIPPGCMKSLFVNVFFTAWEWGPLGLGHYRNLCTSHMLDLSIRDTIKLRRLILSDWYQSRYPHIRLTRDQNAKTKFENTMLGFQESMAFSSLTGSRGDRVKIDDPLSVDNARSKAVLDSREITILESVPTRLINPKKSTIMLIMQRLNERDTTGILLAKELGYEHLCLPMEFETSRRCSTSIGFSDPRTEEGELLFPERFPADVVEGYKKSLGKFGWAGQGQQRPIPLEGGVIQLAWFKYYNKEEITQFSWIIQSLDTAFKTGQENDYSVCTTWGIYENNFYLIDRWKGKVEYPELKKVAQMLYAQYMPTNILIEDKASGQSLVQSLRKETNLPIKAIKVDNDKTSRLNAVSGLIESGRVFLPDGQTWLRDYIDNITSFPNGAHDDDVDSTSQALNFLHIKTKPKMTNLNYFGR